jgi:hypothetical protein
MKAVKYHLENKFLVTGAETLEPRPHVPHDSREGAINRARQILVNEGNRQQACIVWAPIAVVELQHPPIIVRDLV